jgi:hypothetical protein
MPVSLAFNLLSLILLIKPTIAHKPVKAKSQSHLSLNCLINDLLVRASPIRKPNAHSAAWSIALTGNPN